MTLTPEQQKAVQSGQPVAVTIGGTECVLIRKDVFARLEPDFDAGPWTAEEMNSLADEMHELIASGQGHPACAERIGHVLQKDKNLERQMIAADALSEFKKDPGREAAGCAGDSGSGA